LSREIFSDYVTSEGLCRHDAPLHEPLVKIPDSINPVVILFDGFVLLARLFPLVRIQLIDEIHTAPIDSDLAPVKPIVKVVYP
jgi:hypothetical protein